METSSSTQRAWSTKHNSRTFYSRDGLGFDEFPELRGICIGGCAGRGGPALHDMEWDMQPFNAHTHKCSDDAFYGYVCFLTKKYLRNSDGTPTDLFIHEYAHILDKSIVFNCSDMGTKYFTMEELQRVGHGPGFVEACKKLGKPEASGRTVSIPY